MNERSIFLEALELTDPDQRAKYLDQACGDDQDLRSQVEELLFSHYAASSFMENPPEGLGATIACSVGDTADELTLEFLEPSEKSGCLGTLSQYEVVEVVGRGGMGLVLRAYDTKLNRVVAIKVMAPELAANSMAVKRFLREARAAAAVSHDHVVTIHAIEEASRPPFIVMEFVDGQSLQEKIDRGGSLGVTEILRIGGQTAQGLAAAHQQGLVHRDVKPANILLENGVERVKLTDFGLARAVDDVSVTQTGQIAGTPQFMSPEQAQGHSIDARSDLFSLGSVMYTMCTGCPPFRADTAVVMLRRVTDDDPRSIREVNSEIPDWLEAIILKLLAKDPDERFQSAEEVATLLSQHLAHRQSPTTAPKPSKTVMPRKKSGGTRPRIATALAYLIIAVFAIGAVAYFVTDRGTLVVESEVDDVQLSIHRLTQDSSVGSARKSKWEYRGVTTTGSQSISLRSGAYVVFFRRPKNAPGRDSNSGRVADNLANRGLALSQSRFVVGRGGKVLIKVTRKESPRGLPAIGANALDFDGRSSHVETPVRYDGRHPLTIEAFVTPRVVSGENQVLVGDSQASGLALMLRDDGHWRFGVWDRRQRNYVRAESVKPAMVNRRVHLAGVLDGNQVRLYVDGKLQGEPAELDQMVPSGLPMIIGANWEPGNRYWEHFAGVMDEVRISKVARYNEADFAPEVRFESDEDTIGLYHFDEGSGSTASDSSGKDGHGLVVNAKWMPSSSSAQTEPQKIDTAEQTLPESVGPLLTTESEDSSDRTNSLGMSLRRIPAGEFTMGTADDQVDDIRATASWFFAGVVAERRKAETPQHRVAVSRPFYMSQHEVTVGQFRRFVQATGYKSTAEKKGKGYGWREGEWRDEPIFSWRNPGFSQTDDHPVCNVSWDDATAFCRWLTAKEGTTYRLPTEAEWEYACRAGTTTTFSTGNTADSLRGSANLADASLRKASPTVRWVVDWEDGFATTAPVGSFKANAFGLYDMHGNVWEWCHDVYDDEWYANSPNRDPIRGGSGTHVFRGGGFDSWAGFVRSADRYSSHSPSLRTDWGGFRVVRETEVATDNVRE